MSKPPSDANPNEDNLPSMDVVVRRAEQLLKESLAERTRAETNEAKKLAGLVEDPPGKAFTLAMVDEVFRSRETPVQARRLRALQEEFGLPSYLSLADRTMLRMGGTASAVTPEIVMPMVEHRLRQDTSQVILPAEGGKLNKYLDRRKADGFRINLNQLGEAVLGEEEAQRRLGLILGHLENPHVNYVSVKISAIFSQINLTAWEDTLRHIKDRLRQLYRAALKERKFVNLDMEEYRDLGLTLAAFREVLDEPEFLSLSAGIVLQAYLPDSWRAQRELADWARQRISHGGAHIKLRLVKGANLAMEKVEAELHGWNPAPYGTKLETDANFRRMLEFGCKRENASAVTLGVASHNLFDVALALELRESCGTTDRVEIEMLEGMANHQARVILKQAGHLLLYSPVVRREDFMSAMAYLVRRLDENTARQNFLRASFDLQVGSPAWDREKERFEAGWLKRHEISDDSRRVSPAPHTAPASRFSNEPESDWTQARVRAELEDALKSWRSEPQPHLPALESVLSTAVASHPEWERLGVAARGDVLRRAAEVMSAERFDAIACMRLFAKKAPAEADPEVSEAVDFARYYAETFHVPDGLQSKAVGTVVVAPPWNFPYAIPCGGVVAALIAGNSVILKPAPETVEVSWLLANQLWRAGVPRDVLQFYPCADGDIGKALITDHRVSCVVLTGGWETASLFRKWRPSLRLFAETSGKNAMVITAQADRELAIKDVVKSAFGHAGQKCSAASLAIIEAEVYDDPDFRRQLCDAASSLRVGPATDPANVVTPLIRPPGDVLRRALTTLDKGEDWLLEPKVHDEDSCLWSPGIKVGVHPGSWFHKTECFGPVLGLMRAESLEQAIKWQNEPDYGLTAGLHSLDPEEQTKWAGRVQAGNLYINRQTTGAIVRRQPFGGWKRSSIGPGAKAGGANYALSFTRLEDADDLSRTEVERNYRAAWRDHFGKLHDPSGLKSEANIFRYRPAKGVILRLRSRDAVAVSRAELAAQITDTPLTISIETEVPDEEFIASLPTLARKAEFLRTIRPPADAVLAAAFAADLNWIDAPITASGRAELRFWMREQAISRTLHRYGQIPEWQPSARRFLG